MAHYMKDLKQDPNILSLQQSKIGDQSPNPKRTFVIPGYTGFLPGYKSNSLQAGKSRSFINNEADNQLVNSSQPFRNFVYTANNVIKPIPGYAGLCGWDKTIDKKPINKTYGQEQQKKDGKPVPGYSGYKPEITFSDIDKIGNNFSLGHEQLPRSFY